MKRERLLSSLQRLLISLAVPRDRLDEVMGDLEDGYRTRRVRLGEPAARRHLRREVASLVLWRLRWWQGASLTRKAAKAGSTRSTTLGRDFVLDLRFGLRTLGRKPLFTLTAVGVLGLGIGAGYVLSRPSKPPLAEDNALDRLPASR